MLDETLNLMIWLQRLQLPNAWAAFPQDGHEEQIANSELKLILAQTIDLLVCEASEEEVTRPL